MQLGAPMTERQDRFDMIAELMPGWQIARDAAARDGHMNAQLNLFARDAFRPIDRLLDEVLALDLVEAVSGAQATI